MNAGTRQIIAEKIASTVRVLELLALDYTVKNPENKRQKGNKSPRVVKVQLPKGRALRVYNGIRGHTWANHGDGKPVKGVKSIEDLYTYLKDL